MRNWCYLLSVVLLPAVAVQAQNVIVQQPVVQQFGVNTAVSVPDRGSMVLGGVSSAVDSRTSFGFGPWRGSAIGTARSGSSVEARVWIHDFETMDQLLLSQPTGQGSLSDLTPSQRALVEHHRQHTLSADPIPSLSSPGVPPTRTATTERPGSRFNIKSKPTAAEIFARHRGSGKVDSFHALPR